MAFTQTTTLTAAKESLKQYCQRYAITCGEKGAILFDGNHEINSKGHSVSVIDTNGAGDIFAGTFLHQLCSNQSFKDAGKLANLAAAKLVQHFGARLPLEGYHALVNAHSSSAT